MAVPPPNAASARALRERKAQLDRLLSEELPRNRRTHDSCADYDYVEFVLLRHCRPP